ncbi:MAG: hypothetical protein O3C19_07260 [Bacteroidetes bacterium]|nr:hypothetical protein [Bacteroidota bacterium]
MQSYDIIDVLESEEAITFISENINADLPSISLKYAGKTSFNFTICLQLVAVYGKAQKKIPLFWNKRLAIDQRSYEQCTSQAVAEYKCSFIKGETLLDITGGIGVDSIFLSSTFQSVKAVEKNMELHQLAAYNVTKLDIPNLIRLCGEGANYLDQKYDWIYVDPDRRPGNARAVALPSLEPNVLDLLPDFKHCATWVYIKLSPLFDLSEIWRQFINVKTVHLIAERGEIKEVGVILDMSRFSNQKTVVLRDVYSDFSQEINLEAPNVFNFSEEVSGPYLLVPIALVSKAGAAHFFLKETLSTKHETFDLYFSKSSSVYGFRSFEIMIQTKLNEKELKLACRNFGITQLNIVIKGISDTPDLWHKKLGTKDGGNYFLFLLKGNKNHAILVQSIF